VDPLGARSSQPGASCRAPRRVSRIAADPRI
jgi:hypothetical protein